MSYGAYPISKVLQMLREYTITKYLSELKVYEHGDVKGDSTTYTGYVNNVGNSWNDEVSSVWAIGGDWILFDDNNYSGTSWCVKEGQKVNVPKKFNDKITSLKPGKIII